MKKFLSALLTIMCLSITAYAATFDPNSAYTELHGDPYGRVYLQGGNYFNSAGTQVFAPGNLATDFGRTRVQGAAWNGTYAQALTIASTIVDFQGALAYSVYSATDCYERWMPAQNSTKASYALTPIVAGQWQTAVVHPATPFGNFSGCNPGYLKKMKD